MKLKDNLIDYSLPTSRPTNAKTNVSGALFDGANKYWELEAGDEPSKLVNAIEIDWNGADLANATAKWPSGTATINTIS